METIGDWSFIALKVEGIPSEKPIVNKNLFSEADTTLVNYLASHPTLTAVLGAEEVARHNPLCLDGRLVASKQHLYVSVMQAMPPQPLTRDEVCFDAATPSTHIVRNTKVEDNETLPAAMSRVDAGVSGRKPAAGADSTKHGTCSLFPQPLTPSASDRKPMRPTVLCKRSYSPAPEKGRAPSPVATRPTAQTGHQKQPLFSQSTSTQNGGGLLDSIYNTGRLTPKQLLLRDLKMKQEQLRGLQFGEDPNTLSAAIGSAAPSHKKTRAEIFLSPVSIYSAKPPPKSPLAAAMGVLCASEKQPHRPKTPKVLAPASANARPVTNGTSTSPFLLPFAASAPMGAMRPPTSIVPTTFALPPPLPSSRSPQPQGFSKDESEPSQSPFETPSTTAHIVGDDTAQHDMGVDNLATHRLLNALLGLDADRDEPPVDIDIGKAIKERQLSWESENTEAPQANHEDVEAIMVPSSGASPASAPRSDSCDTEASSLGPKEKSKSHSSSPTDSETINVQSSLQASPVDEGASKNSQAGCDKRKAQKPQKRFRHSLACDLLNEFMGAGDETVPKDSNTTDAAVVVLLAFYNISALAKSEIFRSVAQQMQEGELQAAMKTLGNKRDREEGEITAGRCSIVSLSDLNEYRCDRRISQVFDLSAAEKADIEGSVVSRVAIAAL